MDSMIEIHDWCRHMITLSSGLFRDYSVYKLDEQNDDLKITLHINVSPGVIYEDFTHEIASCDWYSSDDYKILVNQSSIYNMNNEYNKYISEIQTQNLKKI